MHNRVMRWHPVMTLAALAAVAGCPRPGSSQCANGYVCPAEFDCAAPEAVAQGTEPCIANQDEEICAGMAEQDTCASQDFAGPGVCLSRPGLSSLVCSPCSPNFEGCSFAGWLPMTSTSSIDLHAIWAANVGDASVVGDQGDLITYDAIAWTRSNDLASLTSNNLTSIWESAPNDQYVVGANKVFHFDGSKWTEVTSSVDLLNSVFGVSPTDVFVVGQNATILSYDGVEWSTMTSPVGAVALRGVWGRAPNDVFAVGSGGVVLHYDGQAWTVVPNSSTSELDAIWGSSDHVYAVGKAGGTVSNQTFTIVYWDASLNMFTPMPQPSSVSAVDLYAVWGRGPDDIFASGSSGTILHYDGAAWTGVTTMSGRLYGLGGSSRDTYAVGEGGTILRELKN
jgi:hypothetical protein